jgi:DNA-binding protein
MTDMHNDREPELFVGKNPLYFYEKFALSALMKTGQVYILARGQLISKAILIAHRLSKRFADIYIVDEKTYIEQLPDDGRHNTGFRNNARAVEDEQPQQQRQYSGVRDVPVYKARLVFQKEKPDTEKTKEVEA